MITLIFVKKNVMICLSRPSPYMPGCPLAWSRRSGLSELGESRLERGEARPASLCRSNRCKRYKLLV